MGVDFGGGGEQNKSYGDFRREWNRGSLSWKKKKKKLKKVRQNRRGLSGVRHGEIDGIIVVTLLNLRLHPSREVTGEPPKLLKILIRLKSTESRTAFGSCIARGDAGAAPSGVISKATGTRGLSIYRWSIEGPWCHLSSVTKFKFPTRCETRPDETVWHWPTVVISFVTPGYTLQCTRSVHPFLLNWLSIPDPSTFFLLKTRDRTSPKSFPSST